MLAVVGVGQFPIVLVQHLVAAVLGLLLLTEVLRVLLIQVVAEAAQLLLTVVIGLVERGVLEY